MNLRRLLPLLLIAGFVLVAAVPGWRLKLLIDPLEPGAQKAEVVLYATAWCPYCARTRDFLEAAEIPYTEYDVERSDAGLAGYRRLGGGGVPLLRIGDTTVRGFDPEAIRAALENPH